MLILNGLYHNTKRAKTIQNEPNMAKSTKKSQICWKVKKDFIPKLLIDWKLLETDLPSIPNLHHLPKLKYQVDWKIKDKCIIKTF